MPDIPNEIALVAVWGLVQVIQKLLDVFGAWLHGDAKADAAAAAERNQWMAMQQQMLTTVLDANSSRYQQFTNDVFQRFDGVVEQIQTNFTTALESLVDQISGQMAPVTKQRDHKLDLMHADIKAVPSEVWRLGEDPLKALRGDIAAIPGKVWQEPYDSLIDALLTALKTESEAEQKRNAGAYQSLQYELEQLKRRDENYKKGVAEQLTAIIRSLDDLNAHREGRQKPIVIGQGSIEGRETIERAVSERATPSTTKSEQEQTEQENNP